MVRSLNLCLGVFSLGCVLAIAGCGPSKMECKGTLTWEDGKPITGANLRFVPADPKGREATAFSDKEGKFVVNVAGATDGVIPGEYTVVVTKMGGADTPIDAGNDPGKAMKAFFEKSKGKAPALSEIPAMYTDQTKSDLKVKIERGKSDLPIKLKKS